MNDLFGSPLAPPQTKVTSSKKPKIGLPPPLTTIPITNPIINYRPYRVVKINKYETLIWNL
jgi:hypothetical protein